MRLALFPVLYLLSALVIGTGPESAAQLPTWAWPLILSAVAFLGATVAAPLLRRLGDAVVGHAATTPPKWDDLVADALKNLCDGAAQALERGDKDGAALMIAKARELLNR